MSLLIVEKTDIFFIAFEELKRVIRFAYGPRQFGKRVNKSDECTLNKKATNFRLKTSNLLNSFIVLLSFN